jgi:hypothetical protein
LCAPIALGVATYYAMLEDEPEVPYVVVLVNKDYANQDDLLPVYNSDRPDLNEPGFLGRVDDFITHKGYRSATFDRAVLISSPTTPTPVWNRARLHMEWAYSGRTRARQERQLWRAAFWSSIAVAPFALFWAVVIVGRWVRSGFVGTQ